MKDLHAIALGLALAVLVGCYAGSRPQGIGRPAPAFSVQGSDGKVTLSDFRGQVVVLNFWATWCPPCVEELPSMIEMQKRMQAQGVKIVGISIDEDATAYNKVLQQYGVNFLTVRDPDRRVSSEYGTFGWPETYIIDRQGIIRRKLVGPANWTAPEMLDFLGKM
jgi:cytochrome c biogenesis protein CcmG, thiol:disulfide interchange protein DsbE